MAKELKELTPRSENYAQWYNDLVIKANLAENSAVRGCMVIKPYGYAIWEKMQQQLDKMFKETGHVNAYFPLFIPKSFMSREAEHVEGFAKECAVVTHYRLKNDPDGNGLVVDPGKTRRGTHCPPTSETISGILQKLDTFVSRFTAVNQSMGKCGPLGNAYRLFLRTTEFLWQEGHTAHATREEAEEEAKKCWEFILNLPKNTWPCRLSRALSLHRTVCRCRRNLHHRSHDADEKHCRQVLAFPKTLQRRRAVY